MPVSPADYEKFAAEVYQLYAEAEQELLRKMSRRLAAGVDTTQDPNHWLNMKMREIQALKREAEAVLWKVRKFGNVMKKGIEEQYQAGWQVGIMDLQGMGLHVQQFVTPTPAVHALARKYINQMETSHVQILRNVMDSYRDVAYRAAGTMLTGTTNRREATQSILDNLADKGISGFTDKAGRNWDMASYAEMAARTTTGQAAIQGHADSILASGNSMVIISDSPEECDLCRPWEGQILSLGPLSWEQEKELLAGGWKMPKASLMEATAQGLFHPNCTHAMAAYIPGLTNTPPANANPEGYADRQQQRYHERQIRKWKRREAVAQTPAAKQQAGAKVKQWQGKIRQFVADKGRKRLNYREQLKSGNPGNAIPRPPVHPNPKPILPSRGSGGPAAGPKQPKAPKPQLTPADQGRKLIAKGLTNESDVRKLGRLVREAVMSRGDIAATAARIGERVSERHDLEDRLLDQMIAGTTKTPKYQQTFDDYDAVTAEVENLKHYYQRDVNKAYLEELTKYREFGRKEAHPWVPHGSYGGGQQVSEALTRMQQYLPRDWIDRSANRGAMRMGFRDRGYYSEGNNEFILSGGDIAKMNKVAIHEFGHRTESSNPRIMELEREFWLRRTKGEPLTEMKHSIFARQQDPSKTPEVTRLDNFLDPYMGREYYSRARDQHYAFEVLSMGLESIFTGSYNIGADPDFADFILGLLAGV